MIFFAFFTYSVLRGIHTVITKVAQKDYVNGFRESLFFTVVYSFLQLLFLFVMPPYYRYDFDVKMLVNPFFYAVFFMAGYIFLINALRYGLNSLTNIIYNFGLLVPIIAGLVLWKENITLYQIGGLILFAVIIFLFNKNPNNEDIGNKRINSRWIVLAVGAAVFAGVSVIFTKQHMVLYSDAIKEYLMIYNALVVLIGLPYILWAVLKKKVKFKLDRKFFTYIIAIAVIQNINNIIYMYYINRLKSASFFPLIGILSIISVVCMSHLLLKEKISKPAYIGILLSLLAIYLLGIQAA